MADASLLHFPSTDDVLEAKQSCRTLAKYSDAQSVKLSVVSGNGEQDELVLPGQAVQLLLDALSEMSKGNAVQLLPHNQEMSTQEAANMLNVSRPYLVQLLEGGEIPFHKVGTHRRVYLNDILQYKQQVDQKRAEALDELTALSQSEGMGY